MAISLSQLKRYAQIDKLIIHSFDLSLYLVSVYVEGCEHYVVDRDGTPIRAFSKLELQAMFARYRVVKTVLRQQSAYDEMVGQPVREADNTLEVSLGNADLATHPKPHTVH